jgi:hypothetical protein
MSSPATRSRRRRPDAPPSLAAVSPARIAPSFAGMQTETPRPTLEQLRRGTPWCWVVCEHCMHRKPVAFVPFIIRWGRMPRATCCADRRAALIAAARARLCSTHHGRACTWGLNRFRVARTPFAASNSHDRPRGRSSLGPHQSLELGPVGFQTIAVMSRERDGAIDPYRNFIVRCTNDWLGQYSARSAQA